MNVPILVAVREKGNTLLWKIRILYGLDRDGSCLCIDKVSTAEFLDGSYQWKDTVRWALCKNLPSLIHFKDKPRKIHNILPASVILEEDGEVPLQEFLQYSEVRDRDGESMELEDFLREGSRSEEITVLARGRCAIPAQILYVRYKDGAMWFPRIFCGFNSDGTVRCSRCSSVGQCGYENWESYCKPFTGTIYFKGTKTELSHISSQKKGFKIAGKWRTLDSFVNNAMILVDQG